jgi:hypothetical protein
MKADIFPEERRVQIYAKLFIQNKSGTPIHDPALAGRTKVSYSILYNGKSLGYTSPLSYPWSVFKHV